MEEIGFLTRDEVVEIHRDQVERYGGSGGVRDEGLLASALSMPTTSFGGQRMYPSIPEVAAAYLFYLVKNHPFFDGNKRVGAVAANTVLRTNGYRLQVSEAAYADFVLAVASGQLKREQAIEFFTEHAHLEP